MTCPWLLGALDREAPGDEAVRLGCAAPEM